MKLVMRQDSGDMAAVVWYLIAKVYDWHDLVRMIPADVTDGDAFAEWVAGHAWLYSGWLDDGMFAGYVMFTGLHDGTAEIHVCRLPGSPVSVIRQGWRIMRDTLYSAGIDTVHAYIPMERPDVIRLAEIFHFEFISQSGKVVKYGKRRQQQSGPSCSGPSGGAAGRPRGSRSGRSGTPASGPAKGQDVHDLNR